MIGPTSGVGKVDSFPERATGEGDPSGRQRRDEEINYVTVGVYWSVGYVSVLSVTREEGYTCPMRVGVGEGVRGMSLLVYHCGY